MNTLNPERVWTYFKEILGVPRLSKKEEKIIQYVEKFAENHQLEFKKDPAGNCLISKPATPGYENRETVILQSHLDMVGEKLGSVEHDFLTDPIKSVIKDGWVTAEGTTLGADDGIGIAASLAILESETIEHGPIECLFTADEETGMTGAFGLQENFLTGKILLNLDSEDEGEIFIGCAGGIDTVAKFRKENEKISDYDKGLNLFVEGLQGGHSGDEIHKGFGNAIKILDRLLYNLDKEFDIRIFSFNGGKLRNAIPREASCKFVFKNIDEEKIIRYIQSFESIIKEELKIADPGFKLKQNHVPIPRETFTADFQKRLIQMLYACPHGVIAWSQDIPDLVETSTNLAVINDDHQEFIEVTTSQRSSRESAKNDIGDRMNALFTLAGGESKHTDGYPGWSPNVDSEILKISVKIYEEMFHEKPEVKAIHAGLECGLFLTKYPYLDMISFGPTIKGAHTPDERIQIETVEKFWDFLLELLRNAPESKS